MDYVIKDLEKWGEIIEETAIKAGLDFYPQEFEIINYNDMLAYEAYIGMPSRYPHWSFGKAYEKLQTLYSYNLSGLPYEMVINSNPCIAYLMKDNTLLLQILTIAHVYGHNDFFKNNRLFKEATDANYVVEMFKNHADIIREYINDPSIGYEEVERILDAAHTIKLQTVRSFGMKVLDDEKYKKDLMSDYKDKASKYDPISPRILPNLPDLTKIPLEPEEDLLHFIMKYGELYEWEKNVLGIVREETKYFIPQIETKIMNEGWASYWHYNILKRLELPQNFYIEFIKRHNDVVAPLKGSLNPYYLGFEIYKDLAGKYGEEKIFEVRALERDESFLRRYLTKELCVKLNLFEYRKKDSDYIIYEISDDEGWEEIRNTLCCSVGMGGVPIIKIVDMSRNDRTLTLEHIYDGRELNRVYAEETLKNINILWGHRVVLNTVSGGKPISFKCEDKKIIP
ncbi:SpoVR family protein [Oxobacter pfennigii]|uniref:SpoVR family protein n=1 Tax=Oxobacter pfennigii TaxID=36849 RepID=A0A0P8W499_9CLOT|nr:SpoVR family protein [Oxobacter pfennigii]KPU42285.1 SpoVR family protein [Oxobacter pfennigii]